MAENQDAHRFGRFGFRQWMVKGEKQVTKNTKMDTKDKKKSME